MTILQEPEHCSVSAAEMFWSPLRTAALRRGPTFHHVPWWGHEEEEAPEAAAALCRGTVAALPAAALGYPGICCMASRRAPLAGDRSPSLCPQCKSELCKPQLPAHISGCPSSHPHPHGCTATAGRRGQRTHHSAGYRSPEAVHSPPLPARALVFTVGNIPD